MAKASKYGFEFKKHLMPGVNEPATIEVIIANSANLVIGDAVIWSGGYLTGCPVDTAMLGILVGFVTKDGENIFKTKSTIGGTINGDVEFTAAADNATVAMVKGVVIVDPDALFFGYSDTTLTVASVGLCFNGKVNDDTYVDGVTGAGGAWSVGTQQFQCVELVTTLDDGSASTTSGLFKIIRTQLVRDVTQSTS